MVLTQDAVALAPARVGALRRAILGAGPGLWRDLPWRATRDPWHVLVSEVMLQQTQAARVVRPYLDFVGRFPTPAACAAAGRAEVVRAWAGLGYNRRAAFLHRAATEITERHGGTVPRDLRALRALPGIGDYTARAVLAFAFGEPVGVLDTNIARVLARAVAGRPLGAPEAQTLADRLVPGDGTAAWHFNQALFDLGARCCTARSPRCDACPVQRRCRWARDGWPSPDPAAGSAGTSRPQTRFEGSERQGRGRLVDALRSSAVRGDALAHVAGWPGQTARARRMADALVAEGMARWATDGRLVLR